MMHWQLGVKLHDGPDDVRAMVLAAAYSLLRLGHVPDKSKDHLGVVAASSRPIPGPYAISDFIEGLSAAS